MRDELTAVQIPLRNRAGDVVAYTLISPEDEELVNRTRWSLMSAGYVQGQPPGAGRPVLLHRFLLGCTVGDGVQVDHRNRNRLDNQRGNLRAAIPAGNSQSMANLAYATN